MSLHDMIAAGEAHEDPAARVARLERELESAKRAHENAADAGLVRQLAGKLRNSFDGQSMAATLFKSEIAMPSLYLRRDEIDALLRSLGMEPTR